jgi:hypothetical protein
VVIKWILSDVLVFSSLSYIHLLAPVKEYGRYQVVISVSCCAINFSSLLIFVEVFSTNA